MLIVGEPADYTTAAAISRLLSRFLALLVRLYCCKIENENESSVEVEHQH